MLLNSNQHLLSDRFSLKQFTKPLVPGAVFVLFIVFTIAPSITQANNIIAREYFLKAAFLYNFARLVEWPDGTFKTPQSSIRLCILGDNPFGQALETIQGKKVKKRSLSIDTEVTLEQASRCHILFIGANKTHSISDIIKQTRQYPVLTVSEQIGFAHQNGHIRFFLTEGKTLSLEVNLQAVKNADLKMSSRILTLATIVQSEGENND